MFMLRNYVERGYSLSSYPTEINRYEFLPFNGTVPKPYIGSGLLLTFGAG